MDERYEWIDDWMSGERGWLFSSHPVKVAMAKIALS